MAPATVAGAAREARWTREEIIERIQRWNELFGEPPRAADWNPAAARWSEQTWRVARYPRGRPGDGCAVAVAQRCQVRVRRFAARCRARSRPRAGATWSEAPRARAARCCPAGRTG